MPLFRKADSINKSTCEYCGKPLQEKHYQPPQRFCSNACYAESIRKIHVTKEELEHWYFELRMTSIDIAEKLGCSDGHVRDIMRKYGIQLRDKSDAALDYPCQPFSGALTEKAYLMGFRLGDLNVRKDMETSRRLQVRSSTTRSEQVDLICGLFEKYGHVNLRTGNLGETQIECRLDMTFEFLLPKEDRIPNWVQKELNCFWAFTAGYTDAEGYIGITSGGTHWDVQIQIASCDVGILKGLNATLNDLGVSNSLHLKQKGGTVDQNGKRMNRDHYRLTISRKSSMDKFFHGIAPYLLHADKISRMTKAWEIVRQ